MMISKFISVIEQCLGEPFEIDLSKVSAADLKRFEDPIQTINDIHYDCPEGVEELNQEVKEIYKRLCAEIYPAHKASL